MKKKLLGFILCFGLAQGALAQASPETTPFHPVEIGLAVGGSLIYDVSLSSPMAPGAEFRFFYYFNPSIAIGLQSSFYFTNFNEPFYDFSGSVIGTQYGTHMIIDLIPSLKWRWLSGDFSPYFLAGAGISDIYEWESDVVNSVSSPGPIDWQRGLGLEGGLGLELRANDNLSFFVESKLNHVLENEGISSLNYIYFQTGADFGL